MDNRSNNSDGLGKQPTNSILNVFSSFFNRDKSASSDMQSPVLTSFKELPNGENLPPEGDQINNVENKFQDMDQDDSTPTPPNTRQRAESLETCVESGDQVKNAAEALVDPDLVKVTRVETYLDSENEDEVTADSSTSLSEKLVRTGEPVQPEGDNNVVDSDDGDEIKDASVAETEHQVPVFRTHKLKETSQVEEVLYSDKFGSRTDSRTVLVSSVSKQGDCSPKESTSTESVDAETSGATEDGSGNVETDENEEYAGIDCTLPVPSIICGHPVVEAPDLNATIAPPLKQTEDLDTSQKSETPEESAEAEEGTKKTLSSEVSSSVPSSPKTSEDSVLPSSSPEKQSDSAFISDQTMLMSSASKESPDDIQPSDSPALQRTTAPKTPEANKAPQASAVVPSPSSSSSSPSRGAALSSPPSFQMPALFSGLRVLKKGALGEDRETISEIKQSEKDADLALLSLKKSVNKAKLFPEQKTTTPVKKHAEPKPIADTKGTVMEQLSQLLNGDNHSETKKSDDGQDADPNSKIEPENREEIAREEISDQETPTSTPERKKTSDLAYETFKSFFGPKSVKKEKKEDVDLEAIKKKIKNDKENLRSIFERTSKSPGKELISPAEVNV